MIDGHGVLLRGPSGSGKSDLALRLMSSGHRLVADDRTDLVVREGTLFAAPPAAIAGLLEIRGIGVVAVDWVPEAPVDLVVDLVPPEQVDRMPPRDSCEIAGIGVRRIALAAFEASAAAKVTMAVRVATGAISMVD